MYDIVVIGAGPAGISSAYFAGLEGLKVAMLGKHEESKTYKTSLIKEYPGFPEGITGPLLMKSFLTQAKRHISDVFEEHAKIINVEDNFTITTTSGKIIYAKSIILALGQNEFGLSLPDFGTQGIFLAGEIAGTNGITQAVGSGAIIAAQAVKFVRTIPSLKLT